MKRRPMPSEQGSSDDGIQFKGFAPDPKSGQDSAMEGAPMAWGKIFDRTCNAVSALGMLAAAIYAQKTYDLSRATASLTSSPAAPPHPVSAAVSVVAHSGAAVNWWPIFFLSGLSVLLLIMGSLRFVIQLVKQIRQKRQLKRPADSGTETPMPPRITAEGILAVSDNDDILWYNLDHPINMCDSVPDNLTLAGSINVPGTSKRDYPLLIKSAYVRSLITGEIVQCRIGNQQARGMKIQPRVTINVVAELPYEEEVFIRAKIAGMQLDKFWREFSIMEFVFETQESRHRFEFGVEITRKFLNGCAEVARGSGGERARLLPPVPEGT